MSPPNLDLLPGELLEKIFLVVDPVTALVLGSCSTRLQGVVCQPFIFRRILAKVKFDIQFENENEEEVNERMNDNELLVKKIMTFISTTSDSEFLTTCLQDTIAKQFPGQGEDEWKEVMTLDRPPHHSLSVNIEGLQLLSQARTGLRLSACKVGFYIGVDNIISTLSSLSDEIWGVELDIERNLLCSTVEECSAVAHLLACCSTWTVKIIYLYDCVSERLWAQLAKRKGKLGFVMLEEDVVRMGRLEDLWTVWEATEDGWWLGEGVEVWKCNGVEEGWGKIVEWREGL